jgi:hypothetical protein
MNVEQSFEDSLSPRCRATMKWFKNHTQGFVKPTQKHIPTDRELHQSITKKDRKELVNFDIRCKDRIILGTGICSNM